MRSYEEGVGIGAADSFSHGVVVATGAGVEEAQGVEIASGAEVITTGAMVLVVQGVDVVLVVQGVDVALIEEAPATCEYDATRDVIAERVKIICIFE